ncbi:MAG: hypothetical protein K0M69_08345 [Youngiibacter sp.]|nr:hypothetical protein [Youngiibacter sp.]
MSDGREIIDETYKLIKGIAESLDGSKESYSDENYAELSETISSSVDWAKKCRNKVWLRSKEGTDLAQGCFDSASALKEEIGSTAALEGAASLNYKLESLAKIIATKASVMT